MSAQMFRTIIQVGAVDEAVRFYTDLLQTEGRPVGGGRVYFDCGAMILALLEAEHPVPIPEPLYFAVDDLEAFHLRAGGSRSLSTDEFHGQKAGDIVVRPWGERSFYVRDPWGNATCFVDRGTVFTGRHS